MSATTGTISQADSREPGERQSGDGRGSHRRRRGKREDAAQLVRHLRRIVAVGHSPKPGDRQAGLPNGRGDCGGTQQQKQLTEVGTIEQADEQHAAGGRAKRQRGLTRHRPRTGAPARGLACHDDDWATLAREDAAQQRVVASDREVEGLRRADQLKRSRTHGTPQVEVGQRSLDRPRDRSGRWIAEAKCGPVGLQDRSTSRDRGPTTTSPPANARSSICATGA